MSINLSPVQIYQPDFIDRVLTVLDESGLDPARIVLEVTETAIFRDMEATIQKLAKLRERRIRIAVDDFGTGYSSLSYLRRFPIDILKIARDFVSHDDGRAEDWVFARAIVALGKALGLSIVAEGIEQPSQARRLRELGCDLGQGYLYARPLPAADVPDFLRASQSTWVAGAPDPTPGALFGQGAAYLPRLPGQMGSGPVSLPRSN